MTSGTVRRRRLAASAAAVLLALVAAGLVTWAALTQEPAPPSLDARHAVAASGSASTAPSQPKDGSTALREGPQGPTMTDSVPTRIRVPSLGVDSTLERLALRNDKTLAVPRDPDRAGWYVRSPTPGSLGPSVIAGHVTWNHEPSIFFKLGSMAPGQRIEVTRRDGSTAVFAVTKVSQFAKRQFPTKVVYGSVDHAALRLITCGGTYDRSSHRYLDNVIVFADLLRGRPAA